MKHERTSPMNRSIVSFILILAMVVSLFVGCGKTESTTETSLEVPSASESTASPTEPTEAQETETSTTEVTVEPSTEETAPPTTLPDIPLEDPIDVYYCRYTEYPYFAMVGTCNQSATVIATIGDQTFSSESYEGWFSLRLPSENGSAKMTLTQTTNGVLFDEPIEYTAWPQNPGEGRWSMVTGKNFQFFLEKMLPDFQHTNLDDQAIYDKFQQRLEERLDTIHSYNPDAEIIYLIVPSSMTTYPELVPDDYAQGSGMSRLDKVIETIRAAGATAIDLQKVFSTHKYDDMPLYYKLDSHWSDYGAYVAYTALFDHISEKYPQASPRAVEEFDWNPNYYQSGDLTYYLGMPQSEIMEYAYYRTFNFDAPYSITSVPRYRYETMLFYSDNVTWENTIRTDREELPSCLVIRDSYSTQMYDLIPERMNTTHYQGMWNYSWNNGTIQNEQPDYIIYLVAEWNIDSILK